MLGLAGSTRGACRREHIPEPPDGIYWEIRVPDTDHGRYPQPDDFPGVDSCYREDRPAGVAHVSLWYPRNYAVKELEIELVYVRAADSIRVRYDFDRDGWVVLQAVPCSENGEPPPDPDWREVCFVKAWAREPR